LAHGRNRPASGENKGSIMRKHTVVNRDQEPFARHARLGELLREVATSLPVTADADFFPSVLRYLCRKLNVAYAFIGEIVDGGARSVRTLAFCADGQIKPNFEYDVRGTPCETVVERDICLYPRGACRLFPMDRDLATLGIEAYGGAPLYDSRGRCLGMVVVMDRAEFRDDDLVGALLQILAVLVAGEFERRQVARALEEDQRMLATLMGNLPGMVYRCRNDRDWTDDFVSAGCRELTGYAPEDFLTSRGLRYGQLVHPDDRDRIWDSTQEALRKRERFQMEYRITTAAGDEKWVWEQGSGVFDGNGNLLHLEGFITDVTERKRAEAALRASEERFKSLTELSSDWYWEQDAELRFTMVTRSTDAELRFPIGQSIGHHRWELPYIDVPPAVWAQHRAALQARQPFRDLVLKRRDAQGRLRYSSISGVPIFDEHGVFKGYRGTGHDITERVQAEDAIRQKERLLRMMMETLPVGVWVVDRDGRVVDSNPAGRAIWGPRDADIDRFGSRKGWWADTGRPIAPHEWAAARAIQNGETSLNELIEIECFDGTRKIILNSAAPMRDANGAIVGAIIVHQDVTERRRAEAEMRKLSSAVQQTADCVLITDPNGVIEYVNQAFETITGYTRDEVLGKNPSVVKSGLQAPEFYRRLWDTICSGNTFCDVFINRKRDGGLYYEEKTITPLKDADGRITHFISTGKDITERMQVQERLHFLAHHDALTGLPNRMLFLDRLNQALIRAHWHQRGLGVLFLDLDRFKTINDTLGHDVGDRFLQAIGGRLKECLRERDTVARFGGDEFAIILEDLAHADDAAPLASKILESFGRPFTINGREFYVTTSIGISLYPGDGADAQALLKNADAAMYRAKELGKNTYQFYSADMGAHAVERLTLETSLRHALDRREFVLHYQPQVSLADGRVVGVEALLRWQHPQLGLLAPAQFIGLAEETGTIVPIGEWVARAACQQARLWEQAGLPPLRVAINVSARQFNEPGFVDGVAKLLAETGFDPARLELEITESVIMKNAQVTVARLQALSGMGVRFAVDDFGTGYSSLSYLRRFAVNTLKIDKSFIHDVTTDQGDAEIVKTIIAMARGLKLAVIAEGVETAEQLAFLRGHGCESVQGYLLSRPLAPDRIPRLLTGPRLIG